MINYFRMLLFFGLVIAEGLINFICSIFAYYPALDFATNFLVYGELFRVRREIGDRVSTRQELNKEADEKVNLAKRLDNG